MRWTRRIGPRKGEHEVPCIIITAAFLPRSCKFLASTMKKEGIRIFYRFRVSVYCTFEVTYLIRQEMGFVGVRFGGRRERRERAYKKKSEKNTSLKSVTGIWRAGNGFLLCQAKLPLHRLGIPHPMLAGR